jgi:hypothetical protein
LHVDGATATWQGTLGDDTTLELRFERGLLGRMWSGIHDVLSRPMIHLGG